MHFDDLLESYVRLALEVGVNLQAGQRLLIHAEVDTAPFVRLLTNLAYQQGARLVEVYWNDATLRRSRFLHAPKDSFEDIFEWRAQAMNEITQGNTALIALMSEDPGLLEDIDPALITLEQRALNSRTELFWEKLGTNQFHWTALAVPSPAWATRLFPALSPEAALEQLWQHLFHCTLVTTPNPTQAWQEVSQRLMARRDYLNNKRYSALLFRGPGTDLTVGLADNHCWQGGKSLTPAGLPLVPNLPTFEVFTAPHRERVNGTVRGTKSISVHNRLVEGWSLEFVNGKVVRAQAERGLQALEAFLESDEGIRYLGEVALVTSGSPVEETGVLFQRALLDENASSHIALGFAYRGTVQNGEGLSSQDFRTLGGNSSSEHKDVMIGSSAVEVDGVSQTGELEPLMRAGKFVFEEAL
jgi:aminopeptidase